MISKNVLVVISNFCEEYKKATLQKFRTIITVLKSVFQYTVLQKSKVIGFSNPEKKFE